jgi:hypothetical protein
MKKNIKDCKVNGHLELNNRSYIKGDRLTTPYLIIPFFY